MTDAIQGTLGEVVSSAVATTDGEFTILCGETSSLLAVLDALEEESAPTSVRLLAIDSAVRDVTRDHVTATRFADLIASKAVTVRVLDDDRATQTVLVGDDVAVAVITDFPTVAVGLPTHDSDVVDACRRGIETLWADADDYEPESLTYSELVESVREKFGDETAADVEQAIQTPGVRGLEDTLDLVDLLVLLAARHRHQLYELTQWGADAGVASVGTFSQAKRRLEELGLVDTEAIQSGDVGRPRQRLVLADEDLQDVSVEELVAAAQRVLVD